MPTQKRDYSKILIVEGVDDKHSVIGLMRHHADWPEARDLWPVWVEIGGSVEEILEDRYLTTEIKASNAHIVGVMLDADAHMEGRYQRVVQICSTLFPDLPAAMPESGLITENNDAKRFGLWIMPDNRSPGDLESFLRYLVPDEEQAFWQLSIKCVGEAVSSGARCRQPHIPKAILYTWLAWHDPPGQSPGLALTRSVLNIRSKSAEPFIKWLKALYML